MHIRIVLIFSFLLAFAPASGLLGAEAASVRAVAEAYCLNCHDGDSAKGGLNIASVVSEETGRHPEVWEKVVRRLRGRQMPPLGKKRPDDQTYSSMLAQLETALDRAAVERPNPGRTDTIRRLTRTEYQNAIRDLLALEIDAASLLPADEASHGFDNVTVGNLSPTLLERYVNAARKISRLAVGTPSRSPGGDTVVLPPDLTQEQPLDGLPVGTRGGLVVHYTFPVDAE